LGAYESAQKSNKSHLDLLGITHILNMATELDYEHDKNDFKYFECNARDDESYDIEKHFNEGIDFIDECYKSNGKIFIHWYFK
jgi:hypothetical protein